MTTKPDRLTSDDREKFWDTVGVNIVEDDGSLIPSDMWGERGLYALRNAEPELYERLVEKFIWSGFQSFTKDAAKKHQTTVVATKHGRRTISRYVAVKCIDEEGQVIERQKLIESLTLREVGEVKDDVRAQIARLGYNVEMCDRLIALCVHHGVDSVPEALAAAGQTIDEALGESVG